MTDRIRQARELMGEGRLEAARGVLQRVLQGAPGDAHANNLMSVILAKQGELPRALYFAERAMKAAPGDIQLMLTLGSLLCLSERREEGYAVLQRAIVAAPREAEARIAMIKARFGGRDFEGAIKVGRRAAEEGVHDPELEQLLSAALVGMARLEEGFEVLRGSLARDPAPMTMSHLAFVSNYLPGLAPEEVFDIHRRYGAFVGEHLGALGGPAPRAVGGARRLRVGVISADLRQHPISYFIEPLLEHLDHQRFELAAYHTAKKGDGVTARLKRWFSLWRDVPETPPHELAALMRGDRVDIAIDLAGHSEAHRLAALSLRAAPLQVTYLGYANTTGVPAVDVRVVDSLTDPPGAEALATERLVRLDPCFLCYKPPADAPPVAARPAGAPITLGSFSAMPKINGRALALWARVISAIPGSRLLIKNQMAPQIRGNLERELSGHGVGGERLLTPEWRESTRDHLQTYAEVDIALDPFPYNGTTTTCEALLMGVPVVTLPGRSHASRVGLSLLTNAGLGTLAARDTDHYVALAAALAKDRQALGELRSGLRERFLASPICDGPGFARRFGAMLGALWEERCGP